MNILLVSSYLPYPLFSGGHIRLYNLIKELSRKHTITLVCEKRENQRESDVKEVNRFCKKILTVPRRKQWSLMNVLKAGFSSYSFLMVGHTSNEMKKAIEGELKENTYDLIHVETFYVMQNVTSTKVPIVLGEQNIEHIVYKRFANQANIFLKLFFYFDIWKMKQWEERFWEKADHIVVTSEHERQEVKNYNQKITVVPNGADLSKFRVQGSGFRVQGKEKTILFIGNFRWIENRDAVEWLLKEIWPRISGKWRGENGKLILWIVGREIPNSIKRLTNDPNVFFDEHAPDNTREIYEKADLLLAPIRVGGGGKFKILESMASGVPVVTTRIGIEGVEGSDGKDVLIVDTADELAAKTIEVLENETLYKKLVLNARRLIEEKYDWQIIVKSLEKVYDSVA